MKKLTGWKKSNLEFMGSERNPREIHAVGDKNRPEAIAVRVVSNGIGDGRAVPQLAQSFNIPFYKAATHIRVSLFNPCLSDHLTSSKI